MAELEFTVVANLLTGELQAQIRGLALDAVRETCDDILTDVQRRMHVPGTGRIYVHGGIEHQASAPGQAPAAETGDLIVSYEVGVAMDASGPVGIVHSDSRYAAAQEYGDPANNLAARPALTPAGEAARGTHEARLAAKLGGLEK